MDTFGTSDFVLYREVVPSLEVKMYQYNREGTSECVLYREVFSIVSFIQSVLYQRLHCTYQNLMLHFDLSENNENTPLYGATRAMILAGQKDAKKRVFLFFSIFFVVGLISELLF